MGACEGDHTMTFSTIVPKHPPWFNKNEGKFQNLLYLCIDLNFGQGHRIYQRNVSWNFNQFFILLNHCGFIFWTDGEMIGISERSEDDPYKNVIETLSRKNTSILLPLHTDVPKTKGKFYDILWYNFITLQLQMEEGAQRHPSPPLTLWQQAKNWRIITQNGNAEFELHGRTSTGAWWAKLSSLLFIFLSSWYSCSAALRWGLTI